MIKDLLIIICGLSISTLISYVYFCIKNKNSDKIEIMNVRNELMKIRLMEQSEKGRKF